MVWDASEFMLWPYMFLMRIEKHGFQSLLQYRLFPPSVTLVIVQEIHSVFGKTAVTNRVWVP